MQNYIDTLANKLKSENFSSRGWWPTPKYFISSGQKSTIPPLQSNGDLIIDDTEKANLLNDYFRDQTLLNDRNVEASVINDYPVTSYLDELNLNNDEVRLVLKSLPVGKASGPDDINQRTISPVSLTWVLRICRIRTILEIH